MTPSTSTQNNLIGFLALLDTEGKDGYLGAILVTDSKGIPQEFRCTHPVKPTSVQKSLYGETLIPHIGVNLCGIPLLKALQSKPVLIVVQDKSLLGVHASSACPIISVRRAGESIDLRASSTSDPTQKTRLESPQGHFQPIVIETDDGQNSVAQSLLESTFKEMDPLEPFTRLASAVQLLAKYDKRFQ